jgi:RES domain-containing protein
VSQHGWRIVKTRFLEEAFSGEGAWRYGGRWNSPGTRVVYVAEHASLAVLEILVHLETGMPFADYSLIQVEFDEALIERLVPRKLPINWRDSPAPAETTAIGDRWVEGSRSAVLQLPSAVVPIEKVFLLNPEHPEYAKIKVGEPQSFSFDPRLRVA